MSLFLWTSLLEQGLQILTFGVRDSLVGKGMVVMLIDKRHIMEIACGLASCEDISLNLGSP